MNATNTNARQHEIEAAASALHAREHEREAYRAMELTKAHEEHARALLEQIAVNEQETHHVRQETLQALLQTQMSGRQARELGARPPVNAVKKV